MPKHIEKSNKLNNVCYEIRGPVMETAQRMEEEGHQITKLNIGNPAAFGLTAPDEIIQDMIRNLPYTTGYSDSKGLFPARKAVMQYYQAKGVKDLDVDDIYLGNGVSELIVMAMQSLLNDGDEVLIPAPDYPLWTASVSLAGGHPVHYRCDEENGWQPDLDDIRAKISDKTRAIVVINPNNPTGAVYSDATLKAIARLAAEKDILVFADEIYDKVLYDGIKHTPLSTLCDEKQLCISFGGLSKNYRACGFRAGWMALSGKKSHAKGFIDGLNILSSMRLCSNVPGQSVIQTSLGGYQSIEDLILPTGRLCQQRNYAMERIEQIEGIACVKPKGALYMFPKIDRNIYPYENDTQLVRQLLVEEKILTVQGSGFNLSDSQHIRLVFLPNMYDLKHIFDRIEAFFARLRA
ncbi:MAG: pyridoxal phosphate-dependent aminotransferase [Pseudomonadota bacterium]|nr:pyridoxal phosphate-dependent aminotransferase [Pseudomonadota bacterium]